MASNKENKEKSRDAKAKQMRNAAEAQEKMTAFLSMYEAQAVKLNTVTFTPLVKTIKLSIEESKLLLRFLIDPKDRTVTTYWEDEMLPDVINAEEKIKKRPKGKIVNLVKILPLLESIRKLRYIYIQELLVWGVMVDFGEMIPLAYLLSRKIYQFVKIELIDCLLDPECLRVFAPAINKCSTLRELALDCNEFGDQGCEILCQELKKGIYLYTLSLNSCNLTKHSGMLLGDLIAQSTIRELFLENNFLENEGVIGLVGTIVSAINDEIEKNRLSEPSLPIIKIDMNRMLTNNSTEDTTNEESVESLKPVKKKKKTKAVKQFFLPTGPEICKLNLADNRIGRYGMIDAFTPVLSMLQIKKLIMICKDLEEIDLFGNDISDIAARQLLEGLLDRKQNKLPQIGLRLCHILNQDMFDLITKLAPGPKKKKKKM